MTDQNKYFAPPEGLIIELVTPLTPTGDLDQEGLARLVAHLLPTADGLLAGGPVAGEALALPTTLRLTLVTHLLDLIDGRRPLFFGITGEDPTATRELALNVAEICQQRRYPGQVLLVDLPLWYHSNRGLPQFYDHLLAGVDLPLVLLNLPPLVAHRKHLFQHRNLRTQVLKKMARHPGIVGMIYQGDLRRFLHYHQAVAPRGDFIFYEASEAAFVERPGVRGLVSAGAQLFPQAWQRLVMACRHPEDLPDTGPSRTSLWQESISLVTLSTLYQVAPAFLLKKALQAQGLLPSSTTAPGTIIPPLAHQEKFLQFFSQAADKLI